MNAIDCIKTRRSLRKFKNEQIKDDELIQILEAGLLQDCQVTEDEHLQGTL